MSQPLTFLCVSFYFKGEEFLKSCKAEGNTVYLLTHKKLEHKPWPKDSIDEFFYMDHDENSGQNIENMVRGVAWLMREKKVDYIVALDDFDVEKNRKDFVKFVDELDKRRDTNFVKTFPELKKFYDTYKKI